VSEIDGFDSAGSIDSPVRSSRANAKLGVPK
jgi:hypothetical protein